MISLYRFSSLHLLIKKHWVHVVTLHQKLWNFIKMGLGVNVKRMYNAVRHNPKATLGVSVGLMGSALAGDQLPNPTYEADTLVSKPLTTQVDSHEAEAAQLGVKPPEEYRVQDEVRPVQGVVPQIDYFPGDYVEIKGDTSEEQKNYIDSIIRNGLSVGINPQDRIYQLLLDRLQKKVDSDYRDIISEDSKPLIDNHNQYKLAESLLDSNSRIGNSYRQFMKDYIFTQTFDRNATIDMGQLASYLNGLTGELQEVDAPTNVSPGKTFEGVYGTALEGRTPQQLMNFYQWVAVVNPFIERNRDFHVKDGKLTNADLSSDSYNDRLSIIMDQTLAYSFGIRDPTPGKGIQSWDPSYPVFLPAPQDLDRIMSTPIAAYEARPGEPITTAGKERVLINETNNVRANLDNLPKPQPNDPQQN